MSDITPVPGDPSTREVGKWIGMGTDWLKSRPGAHRTAAVATAKDDGSDQQFLVALEWPGTRNKTQEHVDVKMLMAPEDALALAESLTHTAQWLIAREALQHGPGGGKSLPTG